MARKRRYSGELKDVEVLRKGEVGGRVAAGRCMEEKAGERESSVDS